MKQGEVYVNNNGSKLCVVSNDKLIKHSDNIFVVVFDKFGNKHLGTIPNDSKLYKKINEDLFEKAVQYMREVLNIQ